MEVNDFFGNDIKEFPPRIRSLAAAILSPDMPENLDLLLESLPPRPRYIGPEAWLEALSRAAGGGEANAQERRRR